MTFDFSVLMDKECSLHIEFKWFSWFCNPMAVLSKGAKSSANSSKRSSTKPGWSWIPCFPTASMPIAISLTNKEKRAGLRIHPCLTPKEKNQKKNQSPFYVHVYRKRLTDTLLRWHSKTGQTIRLLQVWGTRMHGLQNRRLSSGQWLLRTVSLLSCLNTSQW